MAGALVLSAVPSTEEGPRTCVCARSMCLCKYDGLLRMHVRGVPVCVCADKCVYVCVNEPSECWYAFSCVNLYVHDGMCCTYEFLKI